MIEEILFLLWVFIRPILLFGHQFFQRIKMPNKKQFFFTLSLIMYIIFAINFTVAPFIISPAFNIPLNTALKWSVLAEVIIFDLKIFVEFFIKIVKNDPKRVLKISFFLFNTFTIVLGFVFNSFSNVLLMSVIVLYPLSIFYQIGIYYLELKQIKTIQSWKDVVQIKNIANKKKVRNT